MGLSFAPRAAPPPPQRDPRRGLHFDQAMRTLSRRRWLIVGIIAASLLAALIFSLVTPREYRASATLAINTRPEVILGGRDRAPPPHRADDQYMLTQLGLLRSRSLAERVARDLKLDSDPAFARQTGSREQRRHAAAFTLMGALDVRPLRGSDLIEIAYADRDRHRAARIANAFAAGFIAETTEDRYDITAYARSFLRDRLDEAQAAVERSERALVAYARSSGIVELGAAAPGGDGEADGAAPPAGGDGLSGQALIDLNAAFTKATTERIAAQEAYRQAAAGPSSEAVSDPALQALRGERARLEADYREKLGTFQADYPEMVAQRARIEEVRAAITRETAAIDASLRGAYLAALGRERELGAKVALLRGAALDMRDRGIGYSLLQREAQTNRELYEALLQRYKEIGVVGELGENHATVVDAALPPNAPFRPRPLRELGFGLVAGVVLGVALAFVVDFVDDTVKAPEDVADLLEAPLLGVIPRAPKGVAVIDALDDANSPLSESSHSLMTALRFVGEGGLPTSLLVTSSRKHEGKSSVSLALAQALARSGRRVLLIDADLRDPSFVAASGTAGSLGALLTGSEPLANAAAPTRTPNLFLLAAGPPPAAPAQLLATVRIRELIDEAERAYDVTIVDAPPVLGLADAPILGATCAATLMVIEAGAARRAGVQAALRRLQAAGATVIGAVMTKFRPQSDLDSDHYGYGYADAAADGGWIKRRGGAGRLGIEM